MTQKTSNADASDDVRSIRAVMRATDFTRAEWLLIEAALMGLDVRLRASALAVDPNELRVKVTRIIKLMNPDLGAR